MVQLQFGERPGDRVLKSLYCEILTRYSCSTVVHTLSYWPGWGHAVHPLPLHPAEWDNMVPVSPVPCTLIIFRFRLVSLYYFLSIALSLWMYAGTAMSSSRGRTMTSSPVPPRYTVQLIALRYGFGRAFSLNPTKDVSGEGSIGYPHLIPTLPLPAPPFPSLPGRSF